MYFNIKVILKNNSIHALPKSWERWKWKIVLAAERKLVLRRVDSQLQTKKLQNLSMMLCVKKLL